MATAFESLLREHLAAPYPHGVEVSDADLEMLDADVAGLATSYRDRRHLTVEQSEILRGCAQELHRIDASLPGGSRDYFRRLAALADALIAEAPVHGSSVR